MNHDNVNTPWGKSQGGHSHLPGIVFYHTAGHGGLKVQASLNERIPFAFRNLNGWYEEDCEFGIVYFFLFDRIHAHTMQHQADRLDGYSMPAAEYWAKFPREYWEQHVREWFSAAWAVQFGIDLTEEVRAKSTARWSGPHFDAARLPEYVERDVAEYLKAVACIRAKRAPVALAPGDVVPLDHPDIPEVTIATTKPLQGRDATGKLWAIPRRLIAWARFARCSDPFPPAPRQPSAAALRLAAF